MAYGKSNRKSNSFNSTFLYFMQDEVNDHSRQDRSLLGLPSTRSKDNMSSQSGWSNELNFQHQSIPSTYFRPPNSANRSQEFQSKPGASNINLQSQELKTKMYQKHNSKKGFNQKPLSKLNRSTSNDTVYFPRRNISFSLQSNHDKVKSERDLLDLERDDLVVTSDGLIGKRFFKSDTLASTEDLLDYNFSPQNQFNSSSRRISLDSYDNIPNIQYVKDQEQMSSVLFTTCRVSLNIVEKFIRNLLPGYKFNIDDLSEKQSDKTKVALRFENLSKAKTALKVLQKLDDNSFITELMIEDPSQDLHLSFDLLYSQFIKKAEMIFDQCDKNLTKIHSEIRCQTENITFQDFASKQQTLIDTRIELTKQKEEFKSFMHEIKLKQESAKTDSPEINLKQAYELFSQELSKLKNPLPIYTQRQTILDEIKKKSVFILIGRIGSGASTELVQYIYHKEICNTGLIVCTQPRSVSAVCFANEVSKKMGQEVGQLVGYQTSMYSKLSLKTKIMYMTDEMMLNECLRDSKLSLYSCIIVDQVTEHNLSTDLLLSVLKCCLKKRNDLKIIILVSNNDTQFLEQYFKCSIIQIPEKDFPNIVQYNLENEQKSCYIDKIIEFIQQILVTSSAEENILIYLATVSEVEEACFKLRIVTASNKKTCDLLRLYDQLPLNELAQLFNANKSKRKIIFSVKCAELLQIIPNICHVIDTGMEKQIVYESIINCSTIQIVLTNKISAELQTFKSGIKSIKNYYLIYTKEQHDAMENSIQPQYTLINPELLIIRMFLFKTNFPDLQFAYPFVEQDLLLKTTKRLHEIDIISEKGQLTPLGKKIASLFIEPLLSKVIFLGIEKGIGMEAIALAAIMTISGEELLQWDFNQEDCSVHSCIGDPWTLLQMYKNWKISLDYKKDTINNRFLTVIDNFVIKLFTEINTHLQVNVLLRWQTDIEIKEVLRKILFTCYSHNLCVYSGNARVGYVHCQSGKIMHLPKKSIFTCLNHQSKFIIYDKFVKFSRNYMLNVTTVKEKWIVNSDLKSKIDKTAIQSSIVGIAKFTLSGISKYIMKQAFIGKNYSKLPEVEKIIVSKCNCEDVVVIDPNLEKGILDIFIPSEYHLKAEQAIYGIIEDEKESLELMDEESLYPNKNSDLKIVFDLGATVSNILQPFECREITVTNISNKLKTMNIIKFMQEIGKIQGYKEEISGNKRTIKITFKNPQDAVKSLNSPGRNKLCNWRLSNNMIQPVKCHKPYSIIITWNRKDLIASAKFPAKTFSRIVQYYVPRVEILNTCVTSSFSVKDNTLDLNNLPSRISVEDIKNAFNPQPTEVIFSMNQVCKTFDDDEQAIEKDIKLMINRYHSKKILYNVSLLHPQKRDNLYLAFVNFENTSEGIKTALNIIKGNDTINGKRCGVKPQLKDSLAIPIDLYNHLKQYFEYIIKKLIKFKNGFLNITFEEENSGEKHNEFVLLNILSDNILDTMRIKLVFKNELKGDIIDCIQSAQSQYLLSKHGLKFLGELQKKQNVYFNINFQAKTISIYGSSISKLESKKEISKFLFKKILCHDLDTQSIQLRGPGICKGFLKELFRRFGSHLEQLTDIEGIINLKPAPSYKYISITGTKESINLVEMHITGLHSNQNWKETKVLSVGNFQCEMCLSTTSKTIYQLASCGHEYCIECISFYLYLKQIPFMCVNSTCGSKFTMLDLNLLLRNNEIKELQETAVRKYVEENSKITYCPTVNCNGIYFITDENNLIKCFRCGINICTFCQDYSHSGLSCLNYQSERKVRQKELDENRDLDFSRFCPACKETVYKVDGNCESVLCRSCETLFCWWCRSIFNSEIEAEVHENNCADILLTRFGNI